MATNYSDDENDGLLGTPFAPLADDQIVSKKPDLDLTVRDSRGRRRFHGAFTGGFSAGHFNTVGSEAGFTPSLFISSRSQRWDQSLVQRKPENFMDSEDLDVFGIAPKRITTKDKFAEQEFAGFRENDSLIDVLKSVIKPSVESIGLQLYKRMKLSAKTENKHKDDVIYGCEEPLIRNSINDLKNIYKPKDDFHGIGYQSIAEGSDNNESRVLNGVSATLKSGRKLKISGEAFGYGVLDDDIEEDAIVYHKDDLTQYDFEIGSVKPDNKNKKKDKHKAIDILKSDIIKGFTKCSTKVNLIQNLCQKYPIPILPHNWRPNNRETKSHNERKSRWDQLKVSQNTSTTGNSVGSDSKSNTSNPVLNANIRAIILGEEIIHKQGFKKIETKDFELNIVKDKEKLSEKKNEPNYKKPLTGFFGNKFTRSSNESEESTLAGGLTAFKDTKEVKNTEQEVNKSDKSFKIERTTYEWHPHNLLCKRFNIPNPYPQYPDVVGVVTVGKSDVRNRTSHVNDKKNKFNLFDNLFDKQLVTESSIDISKDENTKSYEQNSGTAVSKSLNNRETENIVKENEEELIRPPIDLFKAIFASDDESDEENSDNNDKEINNEITEKTVITSSDLKTTSTLNSSKRSGIFADIDFDQLNRNFTHVLHSNKTQNDKQIESVNNCEIIESVDQIKLDPTPQQSVVNDSDIYGPALPPDSSFLVSSFDNSSNKLIDFKEKTSKRKKSEHKKHKKHKKHKSNHKHKRHRSSSTDSSDIDLKLIKHLKSSRK
ncbi:G patch domain-containing protein 1-like [Oppia nitens]|uniref:G patch domain-containing protein 1-like n=1 Tax=Oppia nitens TaxID=1686743 RepID=UPI0023DBBEC2|nr:G patch domain-containing protein 1-like [Oppia nitens]